MMTKINLPRPVTGCRASRTFSASSIITHLDQQTGLPKMVNVGEKEVTARMARARAVVWFPDECGAALAKSASSSRKGDPFAVAVLAGIQAAKRTSELIPLCHHVPLDSVEVVLERRGENEVVVEATARAAHRTGVEMEALTAASVAALTMYDMLKSASHRIVIKEIVLLEKRGGKSGEFLSGQ